MTVTQQLDSEVYKYLRFVYPEKTMLEVLEIQNHKIDYGFNEDGDKVAISGNGLNVVFGWGDNGIYSLIDEDRDFDEAFQSGEIN